LHEVAADPGYLENLLDGPLFDSQLLRGREEQVQAATFLIGGWCDWYPDDFLRVFHGQASTARSVTAYEADDVPCSVVPDTSVFHRAADIGHDASRFLIPLVEGNPQISA